MVAVPSVAAGCKYQYVLGLTVCALAALNSTAAIHAPGRYMAKQTMTTAANVTGNGEAPGVSEGVAIGDGELHSGADKPRKLETMESSWSRENVNVDMIRTFLNDIDARATIELNAETLNKKYKTGETKQTPWPSSHWPSVADGLNYRWAGPNSVSPVEKYAAAYGKDANTIANMISKHSGVDGYRGSQDQWCTDTTNCRPGGVDNGLSCAKRRGEARGVCLPDWSGISSAWTVASLLEPEPRCPVTKNGVTFQPFDIKGLISQYFDGVNVGTSTIGTRYVGSAGASYVPGVDAYNRFNDPSRRDLDAGVFHLALTNIIGAYGRGIVIEHDNTEVMKNQPIRLYTILSSEPVSSWTFERSVDGVVTEVVVSPEDGTYAFNMWAKRIMYTRMSLAWVEEGNVDGELASKDRIDEFTNVKVYEYLLETNWDGEIIGGEWVGSSIHDHPDFMWWPTGYFDKTTSQDLLSYSDLKGLINSSVACDFYGGTAAPTTVTPTPTTVMSPTTPAPTTRTPAPTTPASASGGQCGNDVVGALKCSEGEYCQPWNSGYYQCRPAPQQCAAQEVGVDYNGDDIKTIEMILPWECCKACAETLGCHAYTFINSNANGKSACYLKSGTGKKQAKVGAVSSTVLSPKQSACSVSLKVDFHGNDLRTELGLSAEQCCDKCRVTAGCAAFTHVNEPTRLACYLKTKAGNSNYYAGATSGVVK